MKIKKGCKDGYELSTEDYLWRAKALFYIMFKNNTKLKK